jgi:hypothetical protein
VAGGGAGDQRTAEPQALSQPQALRQWGSAGLEGDLLAWLWGWLALHQEDPAARGQCFTPRHDTTLPEPPAEEPTESTAWLGALSGESDPDEWGRSAG